MSPQKKKRKMGTVRPIRIGLTGMLASGKTTALDVFKKAGWAVISADQIVHEIYKEEGDKLSQLRRDCLKSPEALSLLEKRIHPLVRKRIFDRLAKCKKRSVTEVPLLFEGGLHRRFDQNIYIHAPLKERKLRAKKRGMAEKLFKFLDSRQWKASKKAAASDFVIWNRSGERTKFKKKLRELIRILELDEKKGSR